MKLTNFNLLISIHLQVLGDIDTSDLRTVVFNYFLLLSGTMELSLIYIRWCCHACNVSVTSIQLLSSTPVYLCFKCWERLMLVFLGRYWTYFAAQVGFECALLPAPAWWVAEFTELHPRPWHLTASAITSSSSWCWWKGYRLHLYSFSSHCLEIISV